jgi:DNA mismatch repair protein MutS2
MGFSISQQTSEDLGLQDVLKIVKSFCVTSFGREELDRNIFPDSVVELEARLAESMEARHLAALKTPPAFSGVADLRPILAVLRRHGALDAKEILQVANGLSALARIQDHLCSRREELPLLVALTERLNDHRDLVEELHSTFDEEGRICDSATPDLLQLRQRVRDLRSEAQEILWVHIRRLDEEDLLQDRNFTIRNDRYVLPVKASFQGRVPGIVHDASQTGQTVYIEPKEVMHLGNRLKIQMSLVAEEESLVLKRCGYKISDCHEQIMDDLAVVGQLEAAYARGKWTYRINGCAPCLVVDGKPLDLVAARHPLLAYRQYQNESSGAGGETVVPNDIAFDRRRVLLVTGPNAGGKTVALKTLGLTFLLVRCGLPVSVHSASQVPIYDALLTSLGDEQELKEGLSRFSGHMSVLSEILNRVNAHESESPILCLLDEPCAGTDSTQGAALAQGILEALAAQGAYVMASTHFERLKALAVLEDGETAFRNASVTLDPRTMLPTFRLALDQVGKSNAFETAERYGIPKTVLERASEIMDPAGREVHALLDKLATEDTRLVFARQALEEEQQKLVSLKESLEDERAELRDQKNRLRDEGLRSLSDEVHETRQLLAQAIDASQHQNNPRKLNEVSHQLKAEEERLAQKLKKPNPIFKPADSRPFRIGDAVEVFSMSGLVFEVLELGDQEVVLGRGAMKMRKPTDRIRHIDERADLQPSSEKSRVKTHGKAVASRRTASGDPKTSDNTIDLRGMRVEEALELLDAFLDSLLHRGGSTAYVLHGHGTGALKKAVREKVKTSRYAAQVSPAAKEDGGDAWTMVHLADAGINAGQ